MFYGICLFGRDDFKVFALCDWLLDCIRGIILGINIEEFRFWWGAYGLFNLGFVEFGRGVLVYFGVDSAMYLFVGEISGNLFGAESFL